MKNPEFFADEVITTVQTLAELHNIQVHTVFGDTDDVSVYLAGSSKDWQPFREEVRRELLPYGVTVKFKSG